jgi:hypothetical protein
MEQDKKKDEFSIYDDSTRVVVMRDYATSVIITKFDEDAFPKQIEEKNVLSFCWTSVYLLDLTGGISKNN